MQLAHHHTVGYVASWLLVIGKAGYELVSYLKRSHSVRKLPK